MEVEELDSNDLVNMCIHGDKESLDEYMHRVVKLTTRALGVYESSIIDAIVGGGLKVDTCQDVLDRIKTEVSTRVVQGDCETWVPLGPHRLGSWSSLTSRSGLPENPPNCQWAQPT
jgi:hypothetical protein